MSCDVVMNTVDGEGQEKTKETTERPTKTIRLDPKQLMTRYEPVWPTLVLRPANKRKGKGTNIPKFLIKIFFNGLPNFENQEHNQRIKSLDLNDQRSKTRFHLKELFGEGDTMDQAWQNELHRRVMKRLLNRNYQNILINKHINNKRLYLHFCKKMMLRLNLPPTIDRLEI